MCKPCNAEFLFPALNSDVDKASSQVGFATLLVSWLLGLCCCEKYKYSTLYY